MYKKILFYLAILFVFSACKHARTTNSAQFKEVVYIGNDARYDKKIDPSTQYLNPILSGFYPDPSICRKGEDYFMVHSTFSYYPGIPIFHSRDLVNWTQIGSVLNRPSQLELSGIRLSGGIYAPAIEYNPHNETFYVITTCVDGIGNFLVKTKDPFAGEWSDPIILPSVGGIDPSLFFDEDGSAYIVNNDAPDWDPEYDGHRAIWMHRFDPETDQTVGSSIMLVDGGVDKSTQPVWIEAPHLYKVDGTYYLMCAEGGTSVNHREVIFSTKSLNEPFVPYAGNPILTQKDLPEERPEKITSTGHADLIETSEGNWYAVFLGCRPYKENYYYTGRETFLLPVTWEEGFPIILPHGEAVPTVVEKQGLSPTDNFLTGNFTWSDTFNSAELKHEWLSIRTPTEQWWKSGNNTLILDPIPKTIQEIENPAYIGRRIQHHDFEFSVEMTFSPRTGSDLAGVCCFQNEQHNIVLGKTIEDGKPSIVLYQANREIVPVLLTSFPIPDDALNSPVRFWIKAENGLLRFTVSFGDGEQIIIAEDIDASFLTTAKAGGFVGATVGLYATSAHLEKNLH